MIKNKLVRLGSKTAKSGFRTEKDIVKKFNNWQKDEDAQLKKQLWIFSGKTKF